MPPLRQHARAFAAEAGERLLSAMGAGQARPVGPPTQPQAQPQRWMGPRSVPVGRQAGGLTPQRVARLLEEANQGDPRAFCELLEEVEDRDAHLLGVLAVRKRAVANLAWRIEPAADTPADRQAATWCERVVREIDGLEGGFVDLLDAIYKGFAVCEIGWGLRAGRHVPVELSYRPQRWFRPDPDDPELWRLLDPVDPVWGVPLQPHGYVVHVAKAKSGFPTQAALGRVLVWLYLFKAYALKDWVAYCEMFGSPLRVGKFPAGSKKPDIDALYAALVQLGVDAAAVVPADMQVDFVSDTGNRTGGDTFERLLQWTDRAASKAILGQTLTTEEGTSGTQALGTVHNEVRQDIVVADAKQLARTLRRDLLEPLVRFNFPGLEAPQWVFAAEPPRDEQVVTATQTARAAVFAAARQLGVPVPLAQVRDELDIREPTGGEPVLGPPPPSPYGFRAGRQEQPGAVVLATRDGLPPWRVQLDEEVEVYLRPGTKAWRRLVAAIRQDLAAGLPTARALANARADVGEYAEALANATLAAALLAEAQAAAGDAAVPVPAGPPLARPDGEQVARAGSWAGLLGLAADELARQQAQHTTEAMQVAQWSTLRAAEALAAAGSDEAALDAAAARLAADRVAQSPIESAANVALNTARQRYLERNASRRPYLRYHTRQDAAVRPSHAAMDGRVYPASHPIWGVWTPPNGWGCRCWVTAHTLAEVEAAGWKISGDLPADDGGAPVLPDAQPNPDWPDWRRNLAIEPPTYDFTGFPDDWRRALGVQA
jgi:SPP1 gp7 family putative phage head morphogenesis protein